IGGHDQNNYCACGSAPEAGGAADPPGVNFAVPSSPKTSKCGFVRVVASALRPGLATPPDPPIIAMYCLPSIAKVIGGPIPLRRPVGNSIICSPFSASHAINRPSGAT